MKKYQKTIIITFTIIFIIIVMVISFLAYTQKLIRQSILTNLGEITEQDAEKLVNIIAKNLNQLLEAIIIISIIVIIITFFVTIYILLSNIKNKEKLYKFVYVYYDNHFVTIIFYSFFYSS